MEKAEHPLAFFITFTCHGTWLHGDPKGSVDPEHNMPGTPFLSANSKRHAQESRHCQPYLLDADRRSVSLQAVLEVAKRKGWTLWAVHVRTNHVHVVVSAEGPVERVMNDIKAAISRRLNKAFPAESDGVRWTRHGSTRYLWKDEQVEAAAEYVLDEQGPRMAYYDGRDASKPRTQRSGVSG